MTWVHPAWAVLGIEPTDDARAIRTAYSAKLKAIDPEADPQAFVELREAFEVAKAEAARRSDVPDEPVVEWRIEGGNLEPNEAPSTWTRVEAPEADRHAVALTALLYGGGANAFGLEPAEEAQTMEHWRAILADPRMEDVGHFGDVERWTSELIASTRPRSAALVIPATEHFGWTASDGSIAQTPAAAEVSRRYGLQKFILAAQYPGHSHHQALAELTSRAYPGSSRGRVNPLAVHEMLAIVRDAWPEMETRFDPQRVALWRVNTADPDSPESRAARAGRPSWVLWAWLGWWGLIAFSALVRAIGSH